MKKCFKIFTAAGIAGSMFLCCSSVENPEDTPKVSTLKEAPYVSGCAVVPSLLRTNLDYSATVVREMRSLTAENAMKMDAISAGKGQYNWTDADYIVDFARKNGMRVHGHTFVWHQALPSWVKEFKGNRDEWIALLKEYVTDVATHFRGNIASWDVVNEAFNDDGTYRSTPWYDNIGPEYIELAFKFAREADPDVLLFYNDYGMEYSKAKSDAICAMAEDFKTRNIPIDGIGLQMHVNVNSQIEGFFSSINAAAETGLLVHVSELDVALNPSKDENMTLTETMLQKQKIVYKSMVEAFMSVPAAQRYGITLWGLDDSHSWLTPNPDWPLPFDADFNRKPAYFGMIEQ